MDRGRPSNTYRPGNDRPNNDRYAPGPRRGRTPPGDRGDRAYPARGGPYNRGPSPRRPSPSWPHRYRSRSPYRPRDGSSFRPRSPPRGPRGRSPLPLQRYSRSPPPRGSPYSRDSPLPRGPLSRRPSPYRPPPRSPPSRPRSPPSRPRSPPRSRNSPPPRSPLRDNSLYRDRLPRRPSPPSRRPSPPRRQSPPSRRQSPPPRRHSPPPRRQSPLLRRPSPPPRRQSPPPRRQTPPPRRPSPPPRRLSPLPRRQTPPPRRPSPPAAPQNPRDRSPPPRIRTEEPRAPPSGPRASQSEYGSREGPVVAPTGPAAQTHRPAYPTGPSRGRGAASFGRGRGDAYSNSPTSPFGRGRGYDPSLSRRGGYEGGPPTGPRSSYADPGPPTPNRFVPERPTFRSNNSTTSTYPRTHRFNQHLAGLTQVVDGGKKLPSNLNAADERRLAQIESEKERLYKEIDDKQRKKRAMEREYTKAERDAGIARLRSDLAEAYLDSLSGEVEMETAY